LFRIFLFFFFLFAFLLLLFHPVHQRILFTVSQRSKKEGKNFLKEFAISSSDLQIVNFNWSAKNLETLNV